MMQTAERKDLVEEYYQIAPAIVTFIDTAPESKEKYSQLWKEYLQPCLQDIENNRPEDCEKHYTQMIMELKQKYLIDVYQ
jgi:hypothetical protein